MKDRLVIPSNTKLAPWTERMLYTLVESEMFDVKMEEFPIPNLKPVVGKRHEFIGFFKFNDVLMAVDVWDGNQPTSMIAEWINSHPFYSKTKIIFKTQYRTSVVTRELDKFTEATGIPVTNWSMFHSNTFPLEFFAWDKNKDYRYLTYISGKRRQSWLDYYKNSTEVATFDNAGLQKVPKNRPKLSSDAFLSIIQECKWGLSLKGKRISNLDCKNRREVEYSSARMPLALNYIPEYPFPFEKDIHYVYVDKPEDLLKLKDIDPVPYHEAAWETYQKYFSVKGCSNVFLEIVNKVIK